MDAAAPSSSVSAITVGSSGSTHSDPEEGTRDLLAQSPEVTSFFLRSCPKHSDDDDDSEDDDNKNHCDYTQHNTHAQHPMHS